MSLTFSLIFLLLAIRRRIRFVSVCRRSSLSRRDVLPFPAELVTASVYGLRDDLPAVTVADSSSKQTAKLLIFADGSALSRAPLLRVGPVQTIVRFSRRFAPDQSVVSARSREIRCPSLRPPVDLVPSIGFSRAVGSNRRTDYKSSGNK